MPNQKIGIQIASLGQPLKLALQTAARLGATGIEIDARTDIRPKELTDTGRRQLKKWMDDLNLRVASVRFRTRRGYDVLQDLDQRIDATKEAMRFAYSLGCNVVVNQIGEVPEDSEHPAYSQLQVCLTDLARYGQHVGAMLAAETGSEPAERLVGLLESVPEKAIGITFNPANLIANNFSSEQALTAARRIFCWSMHAMPSATSLEAAESMYLSDAAQPNFQRCARISNSISTTAGSSSIAIRRLRPSKKLVTPFPF